MGILSFRQKMVDKIIAEPEKPTLAIVELLSDIKDLEVTESKDEKYLQAIADSINQNGKVTMREYKLLTETLEETKHEIDLLEKVLNNFKP